MFSLLSKTANLPRPNAMIKHSWLQNQDFQLVRGSFKFLFVSKACTIILSQDFGGMGQLHRCSGFLDFGWIFQMYLDLGVLFCCGVWGSCRFRVLFCFRFWVYLSSLNSRTPSSVEQEKAHFRRKRKDIGNCIVSSTLIRIRGVELSILDWKQALRNTY